MRKGGGRGTEREIERNERQRDPRVVALIYAFIG